MPPIKKKPWYMIVLARMDREARRIDPVAAIKALGDRIISVKLSEWEQREILSEINRMITQGYDGVYTPSGIAQLRTFESQVMQRSWYAVALALIGVYAKKRETCRRAMEIGEDMLCSEVDESERELIVAELDRMLREDAPTYDLSIIHSLGMLRRQIAAEK